METGWFKMEDCRERQVEKGDAKHKEVTDPSEMSGTTYFVIHHHIPKEQ